MIDEGYVVMMLACPKDTSWEGQIEGGILDEHIAHVASTTEVGFPELCSSE